MLLAKNVSSVSTRRFGVYLGVKGSTIDAIEVEYVKASVVDRQFQILQAWKYAIGKPDSYTAYKVLYDALCALNRVDIADYVEAGESIRNGRRNNTKNP